jgi:hypothetical protein
MVMQVPIPYRIQPVGADPTRDNYPGYKNVHPQFALHTETRGRNLNLSPMLVVRLAQGTTYSNSRYNNATTTGIQPRTGGLQQPSQAAAVYQAANALRQMVLERLGS